MDVISQLYLYNRTLPKINPSGKEIIGVKPNVKDTFLEYNFERALDLLDAIDINKSELYSAGNSEIQTNYLFRGHQEHSWELLPSIFRKLDQNLIRVFINGNGHNTEVDNFIRFVKGMDGLGYNIVDDSYKLIGLLDKKSTITGVNSISMTQYFDFPKESQLNELALAQHFGVETRLLDFTMNPLTALFFASENIFPFSKLDKEKKIGLWVIPKLLIDAVNLEKYLKLIDVKKYQNKYISAQNGVFLNYIPSTSQFNKYEFPHTSNGSIGSEYKIKSLDEVLIGNHKNENLNKLINEHIGKPMLFTLPYDELPIIAKRLDQLNINWITMMPSLDGAKKEAIRQGNRISTF